MKVTASGTLLVVVFLIFLVSLFLAKDYLLAAHINGSAVYFSSDAPVYYASYIKTYYSVDILKTWEVFLRASPILFLILTGGNLFPIQIFNLAVMFVTMRIAFSCLKTFEGRMIFLASSLLFPYYVLGFLSLNKEVYAMCSAIIYGCYMIRGRIRYLLLALLLALIARYYMVASLLMLMVVVPRRGKVHWLMIVGALVVVSLVAPVAGSVVPQYSSEGLLEGSGATGKLFDAIVKNYGYALLYPVKYVLLLLVRPYGYLVGGNNDAIGAIVSVLSIVAICIALWIRFGREINNIYTRKLIISGFVAPIPLMWSEIMHWRYYSFVYFLFLLAIVVYFEERVGEIKGASSRAERRPSVKGGSLAVDGGTRS